MSDKLKLYLSDTFFAAGVSSRVLTMRHQLAATGLILPSDAWEYVMEGDAYC